MPKVQLQANLTAYDTTHATFGYAYDVNYLSSHVISRQIFDMLGKPESITIKIESH